MSADPFKKHLIAQHLAAVKRQQERDRQAGRARVGTSGGLFDQLLVGRLSDQYMEAAGVLIDRAVEMDAVSRLAFPAFFLLRHALELLLKDVLRSVYRLRLALDLDVSGRKLRRVVESHDLNQLLSDLLESSCIPLRDDDVAVMRSLVEEVHRRDSGGTWARYREVSGETLEEVLPPEQVLELRQLHNRLVAVHRYCFDFGVGGSPRGIGLQHDYQAIEEASRQGKKREA